MARPVKSVCTTSDRSRIVHRSFADGVLDMGRGYQSTEASMPRKPAGPTRQPSPEAAKPPKPRKMERRQRGRKG
jgi:hypothetical protein